MGKSTRKPFEKATRATIPLQLVHSDICGPMNVRARHGATYFITFIDDVSRKVWAYPMARKSATLQVFEKWLALVDNQGRSFVAYALIMGRISLR